MFLPWRRRPISARQLHVFLEWPAPVQRSWLRHPAVKAASTLTCDCGEYALPWPGQYDGVRTEVTLHAAGVCQPTREVVW